MNLHLQNSSQSKSGNRRFLSWARAIGLDASAGALCGSLFGFLYAGLDMLIDAAPAAEKFLQVGVGFALCGGAVGALLGLFCLFATPETALDSRTSGANRSGDITASSRAQTRRDRRVDNRFPIGKRGTVALIR